MATTLLGILPGTPAQNEESDTGFITKRRVYLIRSDSTTEDEAVVLATTDLPQELDPFEDENGLVYPYVVVNRRAKKAPDPWTWEVEVEWSSRFVGERLQTDFSIEGRREAFEYDTAGRVVVNTAGELLVPTQEVERAVLVVTYTRDEVGFDPLRARSLMYSMNLDTHLVLGRPFQPRECWMADIRAADLKENTIRHRVQYVVKIGQLWAVNPSAEFALDTVGSGPWDLIAPNVGYSSLVNGVLQEIRERGQRPPVPRKLNLDGTLMADQTQAARWRSFSKYFSKSWAPLLLNT